MHVRLQTQKGQEGACWLHLEIQCPGPGQGGSGQQELLEGHCHPPLESALPRRDSQSMC